MSGNEQNPAKTTEPVRASSPNSANERAAPAVDYSRWMTDIWSEIADLKVHHTLLPATHNAGADMEQLWGFEELFAACQDDTFSYQLHNGARVFDLRIADYSYNKPVGRNGSKLVEEVGFEHMIVTGRYLQDCVETIRTFAANNPKELIILSIESYKTGQVNDSIGRCQRYLAPLNNLLIPPSAKNMTLKQISQIHPGRSVIIATPDSLMTANYWPAFGKKWAGVDSSLSRLVEYTEEHFKHILQGNIAAAQYPWIFNAHARNANGPLRLTSSSDYFRKFFDPTLNTGMLANIVNVDFFKGTGLVDFCIDITKKRAKQYPFPTPPTGLSAAQIDMTEQVRLTWNAPTDGQVHYYEISANGEITKTPHITTGILETVPPGSYTYKVRAVDALDRRSDYSSEFILHVTDIAPPSTPGKFRPSDIRMTSVKLTWTPSHDVSGIKRYEIKCNDAVLDYTSELFYSLQNLDRASEYRFEVRAEDNVGFYSKPASITLERRPGPPTLPSFTIDELEWSPGKHFGVLEWKESYSSNLDYDYQVKITPGSVIYIAKSALAHWMLVDEGTAYTIEIRARLRGGEELSDPLIHTFTADTSVPGKLSNLNSIITSETSATLTWAKENNNGGYAVSINEGAPAFISPSNSFTTHKMIRGENNIGEVWAVSPLGVPGESSAIMLSGGPTRPGTPEVSKLTATSATITWTPSARAAGYEISIENSPPIVISQLSHTYTDLKETTPYTVKTRAVDNDGRFSPPVYVQFTTKKEDASPPLPPTNLHVTFNQSKIVKLAWDAPEPDLAGYVITVLGKPKNVSETNYTMYNMVPGIPFIISVQSKNYATLLSEKVFITVIPIL